MNDFKIKDIVKGLMICTFISGFLIGILSVLILIYSTIWRKNYMMSM